MSSKKIAELFFKDVAYQQQTALFDNLSDMFYFVKNDKFEFVTANNTLLQHFSMDSLDDIVGKTDYDILKYSQAEKFRVDDQKILTTGCHLNNVVELVGDGVGQVRWYITSKMPIMNRFGKIVGLQGITRDVDRSQNAIVPYHVLKDVILLIQSRYMTGITLEELAAEVHMSVSTLERKFKKYFNTTPLKYIKNLRVEEACKLLLDLNKNLSEIALDVGFCDQSYFTKEFKKVKKMTPRQYRNKVAETQ